MASGNYTRKPRSQELNKVRSVVPARATRQLPALAVAERETRPASLPKNISKPLQFAHSIDKPFITINLRQVIHDIVPNPLERYKPWLKILTLCMVSAILFSAVLLSSAIFQRPSSPQLVNYFGGKVYDVQVGGSLADSWQTNQPLPPKVPIPSQTGPYSVLGKPTISVDFINKVLASYNSPAAGKGQTLYDLGVKYGIDPAFALAFFMHESTFGTQGEARSSLSLGNIRCIPNFRCKDNFAWFNTWEDGFAEWYKLIRNLYVAQWGLTTVDKIIPTYAPTSDNNNEAGYIGALKHYLDTWHAGILRP